MDGRGPKSEVRPADEGVRIVVPRRVATYITLAVVSLLGGGTWHAISGESPETHSRRPPVQTSARPDERMTEAEENIRNLQNEQAAARSREQRRDVLITKLLDHVDDLQEALSRIERRQNGESVPVPHTRSNAN